MRVLSVVGGGIKGYATTLWMDALEQRLGAPLYTRLDLVAGTSVGALIGCGVSSGMEAHRIASLLRERGAHIFRPPGWSGWLSRIWDQGLSRPRYAAEPAAAELRRVFGSERMGSLRVPTMVVAYDATAPDFRVFKSWRPSGAEWPIWSACMASSAAPVYFPAHVAGGVAYLDGGLGANDPAACALAEALRLGATREQIAVVCVSAGDEPAPGDPDDLRTRGAAEWALEILPAMFHAQVRSTSYIVRQLLPEGRCVQVRIPLESGSLDDASPQNLASMERAFEAHFATEAGAAEIERAVALLAPPAREAA